MLKHSLSALLFVAGVICVAGNVRADEAEVKAASEKVKDEALKKHLLDNIDIFGKGDYPAIYIFAPGQSADEDIKGELLTRDFSRDDFFMQNIDREEFELKVTLREINGTTDDEEKKKQAEALKH